MLNPLNHALGALPFYALGPNPAVTGCDTPRRKALMRPEASATFVLPLKQSLFRDARVMPGTTRMLCLLAGWAGHGRPIETTLSVLGRHLGRSERQIQRYLKDAAEEGYLFVTKVANRLGYIVGLRIRLNPAAIYANRKTEAERGEKRGRGAQSRPQTRRNQATTQESDTNEKIIISMDSDDAFDRKLRSICERNGIPHTLI